MQDARRWLGWLKRAVPVLVLAGLACTPAAFLNNTASLGGTTPGSRGNISVAFINNTPYRAIFTYGSYDPQNTAFAPQFGQFTASADAEFRLEGNSEAAPVSFQCGRAMGVGDERLIQLIRDQGLTGTADAAALQPGVAFSDRPLDDPQAAEATVGRVPGVTTLQGVEFPCDALLTYTFELDPAQPSGVRVDLQVILP